MEKESIIGGLDILEKKLEGREGGDEGMVRLEKRVVKLEVGRGLKLVGGESERVELMEERRVEVGEEGEGEEEEEYRDERFESGEGEGKRGN